MTASMIFGYADDELRAAVAKALSESIGSLNLDLPFPGNYPARPATITVDLLDPALLELWEAIHAAYERLAVKV